MDEIFGYIERITFQNHDNGFTVAQLKSPRIADLICIVGSMAHLQPGETIRCKGHWKNHLIHGRQFDAVEYHVEAPADIIGIQKYLGSGLIKGIGPVYAKKITDTFGIDTLNVIDQTPDRLQEIKGLGKKKMALITTCWNDQKLIRELMIYIQSLGMSPAFANKIFKTYGNQSIEKIKENPYNLAREIFGVGFRSADQLAQKMGIAKDSAYRIDAGIEYVLSELSSDGHVCYPIDDYVLEAQKTLETEPQLIRDRIDVLAKEDRVELFDLLNEQQMMRFIWSKPLFLAEIGIARELKRIREGFSQIRKIDAEKALEWIQNKISIELAENQKLAITKTFESKIHIITGGPGTGKSTITKAILGIADKLTNRILLAAPTGRAAKRMTEITGRKASTIHSMLEFDFKNGGFKRNRQNPLECDLIIIDEASMIDTLLMNQLVKAIPTFAKVVFVGDINQLPSVGPGNVLKDLISSNQIAVTSLNEIFRQAAGSKIIVNSHRINNGNFPDIQNNEQSDFFFLEDEEPENVLKTIINLVTLRLPKKYGFNPVDEIQVLAPMKKGIVGTINLNTVLQESLNPKGEPLFRSGRKFLPGDKVMQIRNNYKKEVYNGDVGRILEINNVEQSLVVGFDEKEVEYDFTEVDELVLAYAVSIHKYQGSECPCVIMPVHTTHFMMLHRNLLYTGVTRGKKLVVLVGTKKALSIAVKNDVVRRRYTGLQQAMNGIHYA
jgi:exodeoxyribonuclease V alpha subunit